MTAGRSIRVEGHGRLRGMGLLLGGALLAAGLPSGALRAQTAPAAAAPAAATATAQGQGQSAIRQTEPLVTTVTAESAVKEITLVGRTEDEVIYTDGKEASGVRKRLPIEKVEEARFDFKYDAVAVFIAVRTWKWEEAIQLLYPAVRPTLFYLDLPNNNAAQQALEMGQYMLRAAERRMRAATTPEQEAAVHKLYENAYSVLTYVGKAQWGSIGPIARLRSLECLLAMKKPKTARHIFGQIAEPMPGDAAYGVYWLVSARIKADGKDYRGALEAAVKSLCFENKDIGTFPDALMLSARCYGEVQEWYRARDVYYEVARLLPRTDWAEQARERLAFIMEQGLTRDKEPTPIENVFFKFSEDMNAKVEDFLKAGEPAEEDPEAEELEEEDLDAVEENTEDRIDLGTTEEEGE